jgi:hypothetical protein
LRESSKIYIENNQQIERKIILQDQEITPLFDTPHLIKGIRNYRITKDFGLGSKRRNFKCEIGPYSEGLSL